MAAPLSVTCNALAKVNLYLHVTGQRGDGYHELDSLVVFADVGDRITATQSDDLSLHISGPFAPQLNGELQNNLVLKAARALALHAHLPGHAQLHLEKNLPIASGIGGGSADAAATLLALTQLWGLELHDDHLHHAAHQMASHKDTVRALATLFKVWQDDLSSHRLQTLALGLGADVPVCLEGRAVFMGGIGEKLDLAPHLPPVWLVLANPGVALSTPAVFQAREGDFSSPARFYETPRDAAQLAALLSERRNDLTAPALSLAPVIGEMLALLEAQEGALLARMSGSGATGFTLFSTPQAATLAASRVQSAQPTWWVAAAKMVDTPQAL